MIMTIVFDTINVILSLIIFSVVAFKLTTKLDKFTPIEAIGMGLLAAGCIMTIGPITLRPSPYDDWSGSVMRLGMAIYFIGRLTRHAYNNWIMRKRAGERMAR